MLFLEIAQANGGNDIEDAVITVPLHFSDEQRVAMRYISYSFAELIVPYSHLILQVLDFLIFVIWEKS